MDYKQKYEEALERAKQIRQFSSNQLERIRMEEVFPELTESEDERIRKALIKGISKIRPNTPFLDTNITREDAISWLEKQGEQKPFDYENANIQQKDFASKNEPKFKVGDWVVDNRTGVVHYIANIKGTVNGCYYVFGNDKGLLHIDNESDYHLWTIQDAKDGDVLSNGKMIVIFKHFEEPSYRQHIVAYIGLDRGGDIQITDDTWRLGIDKAKPATKEQRDLLFQKMKEEGYEWDDEKKELKKIEQKPTWSEEDDAYKLFAISAVEYYYDEKNPLRKDLIEWFNSLKERI